MSLMRNFFQKGKPPDEPCARVAHWARTIETDLAVAVSLMQNFFHKGQSPDKPYAQVAH